MMKRSDFFADASAFFVKTPNVLLKIMHTFKFTPLLLEFWFPSL